MRLIDADELKLQFSIKDIIQKIDNAPTVERLQGEWLHDNLYLDVKCSICNSYALERGDYPELSKYCPACGAKMEIEQ